MNVSIVPMPPMLDLRNQQVGFCILDRPCRRDVLNPTFSVSISMKSSAYTVSDTPGSPDFFYADERQGDGSFKRMALDGAGHGEFYAQLANHEENVLWHAMFLKDKGCTI